MQYPQFFSQEPPDIYHWLYRYLRKEECTAFPCIPSVTLRLEHVIKVQSAFLLIVNRSCWQCFEYWCWSSIIELMMSMPSTVSLWLKKWWGSVSHYSGWRQQGHPAGLKFCASYPLSLNPSVLWRCWLGGRKGIRPVKTEWWGTGVVVCLERGANDLHMVQLMPLPPYHLLLQ